jgi:hypothetical protein
MKTRYLNLITALCLFFTIGTLVSPAQNKTSLALNDSGYFEKQGLNILFFNNWYNGLFSDSKISGIEIIHHGVRTATNGDVRLNSTPEQWDPIPVFGERKIDKAKGSIEASLSYPGYNFKYKIKAELNGDLVYLRVILDKPLPDALANKAGFNMEFLPAAYFHKSFIMDDKSGIFPIYPTGRKESATTEPLPLATGKLLVLSPEDPYTRVSVKSNTGDIMLYDGRNKAQNGWFVIRTMLPAGKTGVVAEWVLSANALPGWIRQPVIAHSQVGYHPSQNKVAVIELDKNDNPLPTARLLKVSTDGSLTETFKGEAKKWGNYLRYNYLTFDFSSVKDNGLYVIEYGRIQTKPFRISADVYANIWHPTLDVYFPVAMDHMTVNEAYRIWHGASHLDDALQAPVNHEHFDLYGQGPTTDTPYKPGEHIPGLNIGGWYDAGDFDIRTQTNYAVVINMVHAWESFSVKRDETTINQKNRYVDIHVPDQIPDLLQQIEHGTLALIAQHRAVGHAVHGIIEAHLSQYTHLGDASTKTDNLIYNPKLDSLQSDGFTSGTFDDRWAFTSKSTPLNYGSIAALAAASRALRGYNNTLADECLSTARKVWAEEHTHTPDIFYVGNTTGGPLDEEELKAAAELFVSTKDKIYADRITEMLPIIEKNFPRLADIALWVVPYMNETYKQKIRSFAVIYRNNLEGLSKANPFGVFIGTGGWAGNGQVIDIAITNYLLYKAFPDVIDREQVFRGLNYILGCHPDSDISFVSGVGTVSKEVAYGNNRADFSFIPGGIVPGVLILKPDFPENKENWPFLWGENEYVVNLGASYLYLVHAVNDLLNSK